MPPRISVVVPVYDVAPYLEACLRSLAAQTVGDELEVIVVDDGSRDGSDEIAERFTATDARFRMMRQENAGLGAARNTGMGLAHGEFLAFADSDDAVPRHAYEILVTALDESGSDFASGNVYRLTDRGSRQVNFLASAFEKRRLGTHVTRDPALITDRVPWNKLFRRSFWDKHGFRFPEGVLYEDIPVILPAHYLARAVDVVSETVYLWRIRSGADQSITQRRTEARAIRDRFTAVGSVSRFLAGRGLVEEKRRYDENALRDDFHLFLVALDRAEPGERELFLELANDFLAEADPQSIAVQPLAMDRLLWELVRLRALDELLEALRFRHDDLSDSVPVRKRRRWYGDFPFRADSRLGLPEATFELDAELALEARLSSLSWEGSRLTVEGHAYISKLGAPGRRSQRVQLSIPSRSRWRRRYRFRVERVHRPDVTASSAEPVSLDWSGFRATLDVRKLGWAEGEYQSKSVEIKIRSRGVTRRSTAFRAAPRHPAPTAETTVDGVTIRAALERSGRLRLRSVERRAVVRSTRIDDEILHLEGENDGSASGERLMLRRRSSPTVLEYPVEKGSAAGTFRAAVPLSDLAQETGFDVPDTVDWDVYLDSAGERTRLALAGDAEEPVSRDGGRELTVRRTRFGNLTLADRTARPVLSSARWEPDGTLRLEGSRDGTGREHDLVLSSRRGDGRPTIARLEPLDRDRFQASFDLLDLTSLAGPHELPAGDWDLLVAARGAGEAETGLALDPALLAALPLRHTAGHRTFELGAAAAAKLVLHVEPDLDEDERGGYHQRVLRGSFYPACRRKPLEDVILYAAFDGRAYSDNPRAIHEELVRRQVSYEHCWVVSDGAFRAPPTARPVRGLAREHYEAFARARYVVVNDYWPPWAERRPDQIWVQTWHGFPLKRHGFELADRPVAVRSYRQALAQQAVNWQYVVSPVAAASSILARAFPTGELLETGLPRTDLLVAPDRDEVAATVRRRLGLDPERRVVLYAPTYRDSLPERDGYQLGPLLDLARLDQALGKDSTILFRRHRLAVGRVELGGLRVVDVSDYPDADELLLAADVLVTDYSSILVDFVSTGRPIVLYTPDLEVYRDSVRGFSIDFEVEAPGPLLRSTDDVVEALGDPEGVARDFRERYDAFAGRYASLNDGRATARLVDALFPETAR